MISALIPFRGDGAQRDRLWEHCKRIWDALPVELVVGEDAGDGPFNISRAFNDAARKATGDVFVLYGADQLPDLERITWADEQLGVHAWCALYAATGAYNAGDTAAILQGADPSVLPFDQWAPFCTAIIGVRRDAWIPFDERFIGWGGEDTAWRLALNVLYGDTPEPSGTLRCLYHESASREHTAHNFGLLGEYIACEDDPTRMRALLDRIAA